MKVGDQIALRKAFGDALVELGGIDQNLLVLDADVATSTQTSLFRDAFPDRFYQVGIAEQNMIGIAAGLATMGFTPFVSTFAAFLARRAADQIAISVAYPRLNVKINGGYGGLPTGKAGATHAAFEDIAIMRSIPNMRSTGSGGCGRDQAGGFRRSPDRWSGLHKNCSVRGAGYLR